jgi:glycosyltransferase involved in cell wall biosynthesis
VTRVAFVSPEPTPYRAPLLDLVAARQELDLTAIYAARTVARRTWSVEPRHRAVFLDGMRLPGAERLLRHEYPVTPGVFRALGAAQPEVVVVSGWSTFAAQAAVAWCRARRVPYVLLVESHDAGPKPGWRRAVKVTVVPQLVRSAASVLVVGSLARRSIIEHGADPARVRIFANTIDVRAFEERAGRLAARRPELRAALGLAGEDVACLCVARLAPEKGIGTLLASIDSAADRRLVAVLVGDGPERTRLESLAAERGVRAVFAGTRPWASVAEAYVASDVFALLSQHEPWGVVVNEAAACGLPLVLSARVGAAHDLLRSAENGVLVEAGDVEATAAALSRLAADADLRLRMGARSRALVEGWSYGPSVEAFVTAVREASASR